MEIGKVIQENRRKKGCTQEQLAELVGVSASAVSKWESGASLPDLLLIAPIARALGLTTDELLGFQQVLSDDEVNALEKECEKVFMKDGYKAGKAKCEALLLEYPNCVYLRFRTAALYQRFLVLLHEGPDPDAHTEKELARVYELLQQVYESHDSRLRLAAAYSLAAYALMQNQLEFTESLLAELPRTEVDPDELYPLLHLKKGEREKAVRELEGRVCSSGMKAVRALQLLSTIAMQGVDLQRALSCSRASADLAETLALPEPIGCMQLLNLMHQSGNREETAAAAVRYLDHLAEADCDYSKHAFLSHLQSEPRAVQLQAVKRILLEGFERDTSFAELRERKDVQQALDRLRRSLIP